MQVVHTFAQDFFKTIEHGITERKVSD
jgi:hypothetical protein